MTTRYLRNIKDGTIYEWHPVLAAHPLCEEISEEEVFPERASKSKKSRKEKVVMDLERELENDTK